ncbi:microtubule associated protein [Sistotremastrum niveocremeum HHB9708]|uniref:Microtubule associated protein n=1 Tax=Sistotremastrum niveocremeum HHB9708 TaxID=1314777 RepID=A0A164QR09_9AGAM|nr:microtubule associated protein [Sistotremastrum niveocremeum HHB9708]
MDGPAPPEEDFSSLPISERLEHKNWKARLNGYETLIKTFQTTASEQDPAFRPYLSDPDQLKKFVSESNAVAQEKAVEAVVALVKFSGENSAKTREVVVPALVDKCLGSTRTGTKNQAFELILSYVEVENNGAGVVADILVGLAAKQPKIVAGCVNALRQALRSFGSSTVPAPPILKSLPKIFAHTDKTVRAEGSQLAQALYQNIGAAIDPWLAELKPVQVKELQESFEALEKDGKGKAGFKPERMTRARAREVEASVDNVIEDEAQPEEAMPDPRSLMDPIDITSKLPADFQANISSSKWKDRKEVLDALLVVLKAAPRIQDVPGVGDVLKALAGRMSDANINCVIVAAQCIEALGQGLMGAFSRYKETVLQPMLDRLKERKQNVTDAIGLGLDALFAALSLPDIIDDLLPTLASKNPQVKEGTLKFLGRCLSTGTVPPSQNQVKPLSEALASLLEDSFEGARNEAAHCLGTLMKIVGERALNPVMEGVADVRKVKVKEAFESATVKCKAGGPPAPKPAAPPPQKEAPAKKAQKPADSHASPPTAKPPVEAESNEDPTPSPPKPVKGPPARLLAKKAAAASSSSESPTAAPAAPAPVKKALPSAAAKNVKALPPAPPSDLDTYKLKHHPEEADSLAAELVPTEIANDLSDSNWKTRLAALDALTDWLNGCVSDVDSEVLVRFLGKKGWNEKNFQVSAKLYNVLSILADQCPSFGRSSVALSVPHLSEKLGDMKLKKPAGDAMLLYSEKTSLSFVLNQAYEPMSKQKAPKVLADSLAWINQALLEFGVAGLSLRSLIEFLKNALKNSNAAVRTSATTTLVTVRLFAGPSIKDLLEDLNPQLLTTIQAEFDKVQDKPAPEPSRVSADLANASQSSGGGKSGPVADPLDDLFPRVELDRLLNGTTIIADAKSDAWKNRKDALESLQAILDVTQNKRLKPTMGDIVQVLKARITDTNKACQLLALDIVARIASGMNKPFERYTKFFTLPVASVLADQKANIRAAGIQTLSAMANACEGLDSMIHGLAQALEGQNPLQRSSVLSWLGEYFKTKPPTSSLDLSPFSGPIVMCLDDRSADVRKAAQGVLPIVVAHVGYEKVLHETNSLKPASRNTIVPMIQNARPADASAAPVSGPLASAAPKQGSALSAKPKANAPQSSKPVSPTPPSDDKPAGPSSRMTGLRSKRLGPSSESSGAIVNEDQPRTLNKVGVAKQRPTSVSAPTPVPSQGSCPFHGSSNDIKFSRTNKDSGRWIIESLPVRKELVETLQQQMEKYTSAELIALLFSHDHNAVNDYAQGLAIMSECYSKSHDIVDGDETEAEGVREVLLAHSDLPLKYASLRVHEPQPNLISRCLDVLDSVVSFLRRVEYQITDAEALCFIPTVIYKLGDARESVRIRVQQLIQALPKIYAYSRLFALLLEHGLRSKVAKARQGALDELAGILKRSGIDACDPAKAFPVIASMIADKDAQVRKSALNVFSEAYPLVGEQIWSLTGPLSPKDKGQLEERLRRVAGPSNSNVEKAEIPVPSQITRITQSRIRPASPSKLGAGNLPRPASPASIASRFSDRPDSPARLPRAASPSIRAPREGKTGLPVKDASRSRPLSSLGATGGLPRPKSFLPVHPTSLPEEPVHAQEPAVSEGGDLEMPSRVLRPLNGASHTARTNNSPLASEAPYSTRQESQDASSDNIGVLISSILNNDPSKSVDALKKIQKILESSPQDEPTTRSFLELAEHTEGLVESIAVQMSHVFTHIEEVSQPANYRLAKHIIQTLNSFFDHTILAESLTVEILTSLLEELTTRLLQTDECADPKVKDLSRFVNMILLRLFATCRRISVFRALFNLLLQIVKPFAHNHTSAESKEAKIAELVLKCIWKLARNIPMDLEKGTLNATEMFPAVEKFLQSIPPNDWRARATNKVPCGDMPLRTIKVVIQHIVGKYGDEIYDHLAQAFEDPSATIVYPYVYRILNSASRLEAGPSNGVSPPLISPSAGPSPDAPPNNGQVETSRPTSSIGTSSANHRRNSSQSRRTTDSLSSFNGHGHGTVIEEPDPDAQLITIIDHISSETTGALHKEGITELHHFLKSYPHKKPKVDKMLEATGPAFRKYLSRALATRAAEDEERQAAVADTLSRLEAVRRDSVPTSPTSSRVASSPRVSTTIDAIPGDSEKLSRLHDIFQYRSGNGRSSLGSATEASSNGHTKTTTP